MSNHDDDDDRMEWLFDGMDPTQQEIVAMTASIRATWHDRERMKREGIDPDEPRQPRIYHATMLPAGDIVEDD